MTNEFNISITFELNIRPRRPYQCTSEQLKIEHAETYLTHHTHKLIKALEEKLNTEFDPEDIYKYGIKPVDLALNNHPS